MSIKRTRVLVLPVLVLGAAGGCGAYSTIVNLPIDCSVENAYEFEPSPVDLSTAYSSGDATAGATISTTVGPIPDGSLCNATTALEITAHHNDDWGALAGFYGFTSGNTYRDESAYQGLSFWARAPGPTGKGFTMEIADANTFATDADAGTNCTNYGDAGTSGPKYDSTGMLIPGAATAATPPDACGNSYSTTAKVTVGWRFYVIPFSQFHQGAMPNRVPNGVLPGNGLLTNQLMGLVFRMPKGEDMDLWIAKLGFYRKKGSATAADAGAD
jgi:hypothetical protein